EDPAARDDPRARTVLGEELHAVGAGQPPRLHAREGDDRRRRRLLRLVQPLALRGAQRGRHARDPRRSARGSAGGIRRQRARALHALPAAGLGYSPSIGGGGFDVMSYTTRLTAGISFTMRPETVSRRSCGSRAQSAVIA